ncbi:DUF4395 domain-containing protein [Sulfurimonas lithotrophica]|uniref:DUF4395 domain-containing protein n=1 Tax=Sulfurimonas lithotrophica TaxID=2590022 RepID=A0A5P8NZA6_9BACT|nr:DUF4395 domain-containing protein [Sulfurimonas lithotrophica]QFR48756.1 DUF4395 domain-containing protein [Sulfurimonas lithotrophica]
MSLHSFLWEYGAKVPGYDIRVINEREARAAAGILGTLGMIVVFVAIGFNHTIVARVYLAFMFFDFTMRMISTNYVPSLLMGRFFVQNQKPEYVGALQKRFAWTLGWIIFIPIMWWFVINWDISFYKVLLCVLCLLLTFLESAFSICIGCIIYQAITKEEAKHCPGGVCEVRQKEPIQTFNPIQKTITAISMIGLIVGTYLFLATQEPKTFFGEFLHEAILTDAQLQKEKDEAYQKQLENEFGDDED